MTFVEGVDPRDACRIRTLLLQSTHAAAQMLAAGGLVAFPTETVYGLGVDARNAAAARRLFVAKGRPADNPLIVHVASIAAWPQAARELTKSAARLLDAFAPGPLTVVLPKHPSLALEVTGGLDSVGLRIPAAAQARELLAEVAIPIAAPSANRSGRPSCTSWRAVMEDMDGRIDGVLMGEVSQLGIESTVVDCRGEWPLMLRPGAITLEQLQGVVPSTRGYDSHLPADSLPSPGLRHPHYRPLARVILIDEPGGPTWEPNSKTAYAGLVDPPWGSQLGMCVQFANVEQYAAGFYEFLRESDRRGMDRVLLQRAPLHGMGIALRERQERAAQDG